MQTVLDSLERKEGRVRRMEDDEGTIVEGDDKVLEVIAKHWEELGRKREDTEPEMGDVGRLKWVMCEEVS